MENRKINVAILFGGKSAEHEVSLQSAKNVFDAINKEKYNPILIGIDKAGKWLSGDSSNFLLNADNPKLIALNSGSIEVSLIPQSNGQLNDAANSVIDVVFPILHGPLGEDGTVQGLLKLANIPFVGAGVLGSAIGMDKDVMKRLLREAGLPIANFIALKSSEVVPTYLELVEKLGAPFFIKPANMGSSVGVSKVHNEGEYLAALELAFKFDVKIIIEENIKGREIECAVLGNDQPIASVPGEVMASHEFYSYEAKYLDEKGAVIEIPALLTDNLAQQIRDLAIKTFQILDCAGLGRVDFFLTVEDQIIVNEINTIPGFTKISMYPKLFEASGVSYSDLIDKLIQLAIERFEKEKNLQTSYL